jgi:nitrite reductase/ring-hydroxylating ferredoxin subunit
MKEVEAGNKKILVVNLNRPFYAIGDVCMHKGCSLSEGTLEGENVKCPCHGSTYDIKTGNVIEGPATKFEPTFEVKTEDTRIFIKV